MPWDSAARRKSSLTGYVLIVGWHLSMYDGLNLLISKRNFDRAVGAVDVSVMRGSLVGFVFLHQGYELLGGPPLRLEIIVVGRRRASVHLQSSAKYEHSKTSTHHEIDRGSSTKDVRARHDGLPTSQPFRGPRFIESGSLGVQLHVPRVDTRTEDPWIVQVVLSALNEKDLELVIQVGQPDPLAMKMVSVEVNRPSCDDTSRAASSTHDDIELVRNSAAHDCFGKLYVSKLELTNYDPEAHAKQTGQSQVPANRLVLM